MSKLKVFRIIYVVTMVCLLALVVSAVMNWGTEREEFRSCMLLIPISTFAYYYIKGKVLRKSVE